MSIVRLSTLGVCLGLLPAFADEGALVIDVLGDVTPAVEAFEDVPPGTALTLGGGAEIIISHYKSCEELTISGGTIGVGVDGLDINGGEIVAKEEVDCPATVAMANADTASATVVVRNFDELPKVPLTPSIVLVGENAANFDAVTLKRKDKVVTNLAIVDRRVQWPQEGLYLSDRTQYSLVLAGAGGTFEAVVVADRRTKARVLLRP